MLRIIPALLFVLLSHSSYAKYEYLLHKTYAERYLIIDSVFYYDTKLRSDRDAFFKEINLLSKEAREGGDTELECEASLLSVAYNSASKQGDFSKVEPEAFALIRIAEKKKLVQIEMRCRQFLGRFYMEKVGKYIQAMDQFLLSYHLLQELPVEEFPTKKEHLYNVAHAYYNFGDFTSSKKYLMEAEKVKMPGNTTMLDDENKIYTYINLENTLGLIFRNEGKYDSAINYFSIVHQLAAKYKDSVWMGIATGNIGICYYRQKKYDEAIPLLKEDIYQSFKAGQTDNGVNSLIKLTDIYLQKKELTTVKILMDSAARMLKPTLEPSQHLQHLCLIMARYYAATGNLNLAYNYMDSARTAKEIMDTKKNAMALAYEQHKLELQQHRAAMQKAEDDKQLQIFKRNSLLAVFILASSSIIIFINRQKKVYRQKSELAEAERKRTEQDLQNAGLQLKDFTQRIHEKNELIEKFNSEIQRLRSLPGSPEQMANNDVILQLQQSIILTDEQWELFKTNFEKVHSGFLNRLREKLPDLTPAETRFMALAKLKLSYKEMAAMLGISLPGVRNYRYRLRKKLNLPEEGDIDDLVNMI